MGNIKIKIKYIAAAILLLALSGFYACQDKENNFFLSSFLQLKLHGEKAQQCEAEIKSFLRDFEKNISVNIPSSEVCAFNAAAKGQEVTLSEHVYNVFEIAAEVFENTQGAFNYCLYDISNLWGFTPEYNYNIPGDEDINSLLTAANPQYIVLNSQNKTAKKTHDGVKVDFGGIAKGYALDVCRRIADKHNIKCGTIDIAGNIYVINRYCVNGADRKYNIDITDPRAKENNSAFFARVLLEETSISVSGDYERYFIKDSVRYCHVINPHTGRPVDNGVCSVIVCGKDAAHADAYSTAVMVMGAQEGLAFMRDNNICGVILTENGYYTNGDISLERIYRGYICLNE